MRPLQVWLLTIAFFVVAMLLAFFVGGLARRAKPTAHPQLDPDLAVAIETARRTLPQFIEKLQKPPANAAAFAIKVSFTESGHAEMMWVDHLTYSASGFEGILADTPTELTKLHKSDPVHVATNDVVDWEIIYRTPNGELRDGAETDRVLRRRQTGHTLRYPPPMPMPTPRPRLA